MINLNELSGIEKIAKIWQMQLNLEYNNPKKNVRLSFKDIGPFCEYLSLDFLKGYEGGGSGGMGFDLVDKKNKKTIEVKSCCTIQNAKCKDCKTKFNDLFLDCCPKCGKQNIKLINDSRFGIDAKELLEQVNENIFDGFMLCHVSKKEHDKENNKLNILVEWFKIDFKDDEIKSIQLEYFENQHNFGKKSHSNLLPNSYDFYKLCPLKISEATISINYADLNENPEIKKNDVSYYPLVNGNKLRLYKDEKVIFKNLKSYNKDTNCADSKDFSLNMPYRNKSLGKERGDTKKNKYEALMK